MEALIISKKGKNPFPGECVLAPRNYKLLLHLIMSVIVPLTEYREEMQIVIDLKVIFSFNSPSRLID